MEKMRILLLSFIFLFVYGNANAQFGGIRRAVERGVERAVEKKVEQETEKAITKAIDKAADDAEQRAIEADKALDDLEEAHNAQTQTDSKEAVVTIEIPEVGNMPYTPSENEFAFFAMEKGAVQVFATKDAKVNKH